MLSAIQIVGFLNQSFLQSKSMEQPNFSHVDTNFQKLKADRKIFGWLFVKNGYGQSGHGTLKLTVSQK